MSPRTPLSRNAVDQLRSRMSESDRHAFHSRQTIHPVGGSCLQGRFGRVNTAIVKLGVLAANVDPGAVVLVPEVDVDLAQTGESIEDVTNDTSVQLLQLSYVYVFEHRDNSRTMFPMQLADCNLEDPQPLMS